MGVRKSWSLYAELAADGDFRRLPVQEELLTLWALDLKLADDLRSLFEEAVTATLANILGNDAARALVMSLGATTLESPRRVSDALDSIFDRGSEVLKSAIAEEFHANVHLLCEKLKRNSTRDPTELVTPVVRRPTKA
jgi:hypothetical protein